MKNIITVILFILILPMSTLAQVIDSDGDGLSDHDELNIYFTEHDNVDTDGDGFNDGIEIEHGYSPRHNEGQKLIQVDSDKDYLNDKWELVMGTGLMNPDSDGDLYLDGTEVAASYDPLSKEVKKLEKVIRVDIPTQTLEYYFGDKLFDSFLVSTGLNGMNTPEGEFKILDKVPVKHYGGVGFDYPNTKWNLHFTSQKYRYYIHGAYWHNNFGKQMSHGCVNVDYEHMEPLYWFSQYDTKVIIK
jgi:hypothetical protein